MSPEEWQGIRFFDPDEAWGDASRIHLSLISRLDRARAHIGLPFIITSGTQGIHSPGSEHYKGRAVDFVVERTPGVTLCDVLLDLLRFDFTGVGIYPHWFGGGGFHVEHVPGVEKKKLWMGIYKNNSAGQRVQAYLELNSGNLVRHGAMVTMLKGES